LTVLSDVSSITTLCFACMLPFDVTVLSNIVPLLAFLNFVVRTRRKSPGLKMAVSVLTYLISIQKVPSSNLGLGLIFMTKFSHGFPLSLWQKFEYNT
jgi:hypothetical protein